MRIREALALLLSAIIYISYALTLTIPESTLLNVATTSNLGSECSCVRLSRQAWLSRNFPRGRDCARAIRMLNDNHRTGIFHTGGTLNDFQLPVTRRHRTCAVRVSLKEDIKEVEGTWNVVGSAATQLNQVCVGDRYFPEYKGGYTYAGLYDAIKIQLSYYSDGKTGLEQNFTDAFNRTGIEFGDLDLSRR